MDLSSLLMGLFPQCRCVVSVRIQQVSNHILGAIEYHVMFIHGALVYAFSDPFCRFCHFKPTCSVTWSLYPESTLSSEGRL